MSGLGAAAVVRARDAMSRSDSAARKLARPLIRVVHSRALTPITLGGATTYEMLVELAAPFGRISPLLCVGQNAGGTCTSPAYFVYAAAVPNTTKAAADAATWVSCSMVTANLTPADALNKQSWHTGVPNMTNLASVDRNDGGHGWLVLIRAYVSAGTLVYLGNGTDSLNDWAARATRMFRWREKPGNYTTTNQSGFDSTTNTIRSPIAGVAYLPRDGRGVSVCSSGDSNAVGYGELPGENHMLLACEALTAETGVPVEYADLAVGGFSSTAIRDMVTDLFGAKGLFTSASGLLPDVWHLPTMTQNNWPTDPTTSVLTEADVALYESYLARPRLEIARAGVPLIRSLWQASQIRLWGASDSVRLATNDAKRAACLANGDILIDIPSIIDDVPDGTGQRPMKAEYTYDTAHFNRAGHTAVAPLSARAIRAAVPFPVGQLIA